MGDSAGDAPSLHRGREAPAHGFDFGKLGHIVYQIALSVSRGEGETILDPAVFVSPSKEAVVDVVVRGLRMTERRARENDWGDNPKTWTKQQFCDLATEIKKATEGHRGIVKDWIGYADSEKAPEDHPHFAVEQEWLFDFCWLQYAADHVNFLGAPLIVESEWHPSISQVITDFDKLLLTRATVRALYFGSEPDGTLAAAINQIRGSRLTSNDDIYLFAFWNNGSQQYDVCYFEPWMKQAEPLL